VSFKIFIKYIKTKGVGLAELIACSSTDPKVEGSNFRGSTYKCLLLRAGGNMPCGIQHYRSIFINILTYDAQEITPYKFKFKDDAYRIKNFYFLHLDLNLDLWHKKWVYSPALP
jgi:hypothetical protein